MITVNKYAYHVDWDTTGRGVDIPPSGGAVGFDIAAYLVNYYTKVELQTSGSSQVHFDNIIEAYHNNLLDLQGGLSTSSGDSSGKDAEYYHLDESTYLDVLNISFVNSIVKDSVNAVSLVNDLDSPGNSKYYGTNISGTKGWYDLPTSGGDSLWEDLSNGFIAPVDSGTVGLYILGDIQTEVDDTNTKLGVGALASLTSGTTNIAIGKNALGGITSGYGNIGIGESALVATTEAEGNIGIGFNAINTNITGTYNLGVGVYPLGLTESGHYNIAFGYGSLSQNISGSHNIAIGNETGQFCLGFWGYNNEGSYNIFIGENCWGGGNDTIDEVVIGHDAIGQGSYCTVLGGINTTTTYLVGELYAVTYDSSGNTTGALPEATTETDVVYYDPTTGKMSYGASSGVGGSSLWTDGGENIITPSDSSGVGILVGNIYIDGSTIYTAQGDNSDLTIQAGDASGASGNDAGNLILKAGDALLGDNGSTNGIIYIVPGSGYSSSPNGIIYIGDATSINSAMDITCAGTSSNVSLYMYPKGSGTFYLGSTSAQIEMRNTATIDGNLTFKSAERTISGANRYQNNGYGLTIKGGDPYGTVSDYNGGNVYLYGGAPTGAGLRGDLYFGTGSAGLLKEAESSDVLYVVTYNPDTGKLGYVAL